MVRTIVTHLSPDLDAICAVWLLKKYLRGFDTAEVVLLPAGSTYEDKPVDSDPNVIHVDSGYGQFDHHDTSDYTSAARKVLEYLKSKKALHVRDIEPLDRLVEMVTYSDHFKEIFFPRPEEDYYLLFGKDLIHHYKAVSNSDNDVIEFGINILEATLYGVRQKIRAETDIEDGYIFKSSYGNSLGLYCGNSQALVLAQKKGYLLVIQKNPSRHFVKIKLHPKSKKNLKKVHDLLIKKDPTSTWIYHSSGKMIISGSAYNPNVVTTNLTLDALVKIVLEA